MVASIAPKSLAVATLLSFAGVGYGQVECVLPSVGKTAAPVTPAGVEARVVDASLRQPRGMAFDSAGHLLVLDRGIGIVALTLNDLGGSCVSVNSSKVVVANKNFNHAVEFLNANTLMASDTDKVYAWKYNPKTASVVGARRVLVEGMFNTDHASRTIEKSTKKKGTIIVNRGSQSNIDTLAADKATGHAQIRSFNVKALAPGAKPYNFTDGYVLGWGMRNNVGIAEHPQTGGIYSVENSVDNIVRAGVTFNNENPGEKLNYLGTLVGNKSPNQGQSFGYPYCYAAWNPSQVPQGGQNLKVGQQFSIARGKVSDQVCRNQRVAPRLVFDAHMAPLDIKFHPNGNTAYISLHGSFNRVTPEGYKIGKVAFQNGDPVEPSTSKTALVDLVTNAAPGACPVGCFRPAGIVLDAKNRLFFSSDATGELYVVSSLAGLPL